MQRLFVLTDELAASQLWQFLKNNWRDMAEAGKPIAVLLTEHKKKRNDEQNKRYWAVLNEIAIKAWLSGKQYSSEAWHEYYKRKFIGCEDCPDGSMVSISSTKLNTAEFADYMTLVEHDAIQNLGIIFEKDIA